MMNNFDLTYWYAYFDYTYTLYSLSTYNNMEDDKFAKNGCSNKLTSIYYDLGIGKCTLYIRLYVTISKVDIIVLYYYTILITHMIWTL